MTTETDHNINEALIQRLADLAKIDFSDPKEQEKMKQDLLRMQAFFQQVKQLDTQNVTPLVHMIQQENIWRSDEEPAVHLSLEEVLANAGRKDTDYFKVPKVMEEA